jgi:glycosyltransferase involved in cell wall biosynthesis
MVKVLIWDSFELKERNGGPPTYLYNLKKGLESGENGYNLQIDFLSNLIYAKHKGHYKSRSRTSLKKLIPGTILKNLQILNYIFRLWKFNFTLDIDELKKYDAIHFHLSIDIYKYRRILKYYRGEILLTSHSPIPSWVETIEDIYCLEIKNTFPLFRRVLESMDLFGFKKANVLVFPCVESIEPYLNWSRYCLEIHTLAKYKYLPSGIPEIQFKKNSRDLRKELGIPDDAVVFSFIGRHTVVKGYDLLVALGESVLSKCNNVYFVVAGKQSPLKGLSHPNWIEVGWTDDPHSYVNASDVFILPNRQTFFDLVLIEVLSIGKPIILSDSGGNKHFEKYAGSGFYFFEKNNLASLEDVFYKTIENKPLFKEQGVFNKEIYKVYYSLSPFVNRVEDLYMSLFA